MDIEILLEYADRLGFITYPVVMLFAVWKIGVPLTHYFINKRNGNGKDISKELTKLKTNDLHEINKKLDKLTDEQIKMRIDIGKIKIKLGMNSY